MVETLHKPPLAVLRTKGTNDHENMNYGLQLAGGESEIVHMNELLTGVRRLEKYRMIVLPGGFSRGDALGAGNMWAQQFRSQLSDELREFLEKDKVVFGVCNGFQVLVQLGLLPLGEIQSRDRNKATLALNESDTFQSNWVHLRGENGLSVANGDILTLPIGHGEGQFVADEEVLQEIEERGLVAYRYVTKEGEDAQDYPDNPNGSVNAIAGLIDPHEQVIGMMPHPDRYIYPDNYVNWRREDRGRPHGLRILEQIIDFAR
ncbi:phosphoribosylformylglycinamidine synthase I [Candidatus Roizmanbacteria bacterium]|nr:phosphoribosylformylglycinamidine synthase I [Candidatus Roizmanbacteria bacterium]